MSYSFEARFSTSPLDIAPLLERLDASLAACGLQYTGAMMQLVNQGGWPTIGGLDFGQADSFPAATRLLASWWGVSFEFISKALHEGLGRTDAIEVYIRVFRAPDGRWTVSYDELSRATDFRIADDDAAQDLTALQLALCEAGGFDLSVYDEQSFNRQPIPHLRDVEVAVKRIANDPALGDFSAVVSAKLIDHARARKIAGPRADEVKVALNGYIVFPFLRPQSKV
jgi:hypothetical protein